MDIIVTKRHSYEYISKFFINYNNINVFFCSINDLLKLKLTNKQIIVFDLDSLLDLSILETINLNKNIDCILTGLYSNNIPNNHDVIGNNIVITQNNEMIQTFCYNMYKLITNKQMILQKTRFPMSKEIVLHEIIKIKEFKKNTILCINNYENKITIKDVSPIFSNSKFNSNSTYKLTPVDRNLNKLEINSSNILDINQNPKIYDSKNLNNFINENQKNSIINTKIIIYANNKFHINLSKINSNNINYFLKSIKIKEELNPSFNIVFYQLPDCTSIMQKNIITKIKQLTKNNSKLVFFNCNLIYDKINIYYKEDITESLINKNITDSKIDYYIPKQTTICYLKHKFRLLSISKNHITFRSNSVIFKNNTSFFMNKPSRFIIKIINIKNINNQIIYEALINPIKDSDFKKLDTFIDKL